ncbi:hypothetical protein D3H55_14230 [Bacillus salacetis]|uniref:Uncharacterized protein n=1 Tax=Bacillus salacetis TaxID=2315464 RepID=A0A3A1QV27_9BACI|nr:hypothetical protein [Bacillus salacetis]RIW32029.1 hypothetical protein D3H55_14230 [Bacillus salacetis]
MKTFSWLSCWSLILSIFPLPFFIAILYRFIRIGFYSGLALVVLSIILSLVFAVMAITKKTEKNILAGVAIYIALFSAGTLVFIAMMGQTFNPPNT